MKTVHLSSVLTSHKIKIQMSCSEIVILYQDMKKNTLATNLYRGLYRSTCNWVTYTEMALVTITNEAGLGSIILSLHGFRGFLG